jgi:tetraacyldisaccharide 4'-kinase
MKQQIALWFLSQWQTISFWQILLRPLSWLFFAVVKLRQYAYAVGVFKSTQLNVPVIVVGNISVGGTGKTPLVIHLVQALQAQGYHPAVISRGYGANVKCWQEVRPHSTAEEVGDEPLLIAKRAHCPVFVGKNRVAVAQALLSAYPACDAIVSDDGLQHYALQRNVEVVVVDARVGLGNGLLLPAGPLRESAQRLTSVDAVVYNGADSVAQGYAMQLVADGFYQVAKPHQPLDSGQWKHANIHAVAAIGNPQRFFQHLKTLGFKVTEHAFLDHHTFAANDFAAFGDEVVVMTEKDAVKCTAFAKPNWAYLAVSAQVQDGLLAAILEKIRKS